MLWDLSTIEMQTVSDTSFPIRATERERERERGSRKLQHIVGG